MAGETRGYSLDVLLRRPGLFRELPAADPSGTGLEARRALADSAGRPVVVAGTVVDLVPAARCYKVLPDGGLPVLLCAAAEPGNPATAAGAAGAGCYPAGARVLLHYAGGPYGLILGGLPGLVRAAAPSPPDFTHQAARHNIRTERAHSEPLTTAGAGGVGDFSCGRLLDALGGQWAVATALGLCLSIDDQMAQLSVDEATGLFLFYRDQLTRLAGVNLQVQSSVHACEYLDDRGEALVYEGVAAYPWEQLGALRPGVDPLRALSAEQVLRDEPHYAALEPVTDDQQPFHRSFRLGGYVGQGGRRMVVAPPPAADRHRYAPDAAAPIGLFREHTTLTGRHLIESAKGVHIRKAPGIPAPRRTRRPEGPEVAAAPYRPGGIGADGPEHRVAGEVSFGPGSDPRAQVAALDELHAYVFGWEADGALHHHAADWALPEPAASLPGAPPFVPAYAELAGRQSLPAPEPVAVEVDHRYGPVRYFPTECGLDLLDDGGVCLGDGWSSQLRMVGGSQSLDAPGDLVLRAGRRIVLMADEVILRARGSVDVSATEGDLRLSAGGNLQARSGGGTLLEAEGAGGYDFAAAGTGAKHGGIVLRAAEGAVAAVGRDVYVRSGVAADGSAVAGDVHLDAGRGGGDIVAQSGRFVRYLETAAEDYLGGDPEGLAEPRASAVYDDDGLRLGGPLTVGGAVIVDGGGVFRGDLRVLEGHVYTERALQEQQKVGVLGDGGGRSRSQADEERRAAERDRSDDRAAGREARAGLAASWTLDAALGSEATLAAAHFTFRTDAQYAVGPDFALDEAAWQRRARLSGQELPTWTERPDSRGGAPWPGWAAWATDATLRIGDARLARPDGAPSDRASGVYDRAEAGPTRAVVPQGRYTLTARTP